MQREFAWRVRDLADLVLVERTTSGSQRLNRSIESVLRFGTASVLLVAALGEGTPILDLSRV